MAEIVLLHHVLGLTEGIREFAGKLREGGHVVHTPDLFEGATASSIDAGVALVQSIGGPVLTARVDDAVRELPRGIVYAGFSFGAGQAQRLAQTRAGCRGALLYEGFVALDAPWGSGPWPAGVPVQVQGMADDEFFAHEGDLAAARDLVEALGGAAELVVHPGSGHLFADPASPSYDPAAAAVLLRRSLEFLARLVPAGSD